MTRQDSNMKKTHLPSRYLKIAAALVIGTGLTGCSTLSMSDFGLGGNDKKTTVTETKPAPQTTQTGTQAQTVQNQTKKEPGMWDRVTGWFKSDEKTAPKGDNLSVTQAQATTAATNASLRAAQDSTRLNSPLTSTQALTTQPVTTQPVTTQPVTTQPVTTQPVTTQPVTTQPINLANAPRVGAPQINTAQPSTQAVTSTAPGNQAVSSAQTALASKQASTATPVKKEGFFERIGNFFSSDKKKPTQTAAAKSKSNINSLANQSNPSLTSGDTDEAPTALTPVQTLRLARQAGKSTQASSQVLTPYAPTPGTQTKVAATQIKTNSITPQKQAVTTAKVSQPKVTVKPLTARKSAPVAAARTSSSNTSYVVTPETYRASKSSLSATSPIKTASTNAVKTGRLASASPSQSAYKFYFNPGSANLAPHHIAQLKGLAGQALARQRQIIILGTSNPGGEAGKGASQLALQNLATARAMAAARNLQNFGVPSKMIKLRIAQSTTPSEIGTQGNRTLQSMSARRVEVSIQ